MTELYFAYGSNMSSARLRARIPDVQALGAARLRGYELVCNKRGKDGSGKANLLASPDAEAWGVLFSVAAVHWSTLDRHEWGYERAACEVLDAAGSARSAQLYFALAPEASDLAPFDWYRDHCLVGAREHALPRHAIARIEGWSVAVSDR